jgi:hypothetical protein
LPGLQAGSNTVTALYQGDINNATSSDTLTFTVQRATLSVIATAETRPTGTANPTLAYTFSGLANGDTPVSILGAPSLTVNASLSSPAGPYPIVITQGTLSSTNYSFVFVNGTLTVTAGGPPYGFTLTPVAPVITVRATELAVEAFVVSSVGGYTGTVTFACSAGVPAFYSCAMDQPSVVLNGIVDQNTQAVLTYNGNAMLHSAPPFGKHPAANGLAVLALTLPFGWLWSRKRGGIKLGGAVLLVLMSLGAATLSGCGSGSTPNAGQYTITVTATNDSVPAVVHSATFVINLY